MKVSWTPSYNLVVNLLHVTAGMVFVFGPVACFGCNPLIGVGLMLAWALPKEFWFDLALWPFGSLGEGDTFTGSATDFCWYVLGAGFASALLGLTL